MHWTIVYSPVVLRDLQPLEHSCQVSWFDQDSPDFVMPVLVLFWLREKY